MPLLDQVAMTLDRPFTLLDIGANDGYFSTRIAEDFNCYVTALDKNPKVDELFSKRIRPMVQKLTESTMKALPRFDVILALSVLHHFENWETIFDLMRAKARRALIIEVPHPEEKLLKVPAKDDLKRLYRMVYAERLTLLGSSPATRQPHLSRHILHVPPLLAGIPFGGSGTHARMQEHYGDKFEEALGYRPYKGSLNLRIPFEPDLSPAPIKVWVNNRRDYQFWLGRLRSYPRVPIHIMVPGLRGWPTSIELVSPIRLRDLFEDKEMIEVEVLL